MDNRKKHVYMDIARPAARPSAEFLAAQERARLKAEARAKAEEKARAINAAKQRAMRHPAHTGDPFKTRPIIDSSIIENRPRRQLFSDFKKSSIPINTEEDGNNEPTLDTLDRLISEEITIEDVLSGDAPIDEITIEDSGKTNSEPEQIMPEDVPENSEHDSETFADGSELAKEASENAKTSGNTGTTEPEEPAADPSAFVSVRQVSHSSVKKTSVTDNSFTEFEFGVIEETVPGTERQVAPITSTPTPKHSSIFKKSTPEESKSPFLTNLSIPKRPLSASMPTGDNAPRPSHIAPSKGSPLPKPAKKKSKKSSTPFIVIIILSVLLGVTLGALVYFVLPH